jgi:hypothetical protein
MGRDMLLLEDIKAFCETHELSIWQFGELAMNDKSFVKNLDNGRRVWPETEAKVRRFMATYRPDAEQDAAA